MWWSRKRYESSLRERAKKYWMRSYPKEEGVTSYKEACKYINLDTEMNRGLINNLCGEQGQNTVYVCGQAKSHCVADSIIDLLKEGKGKVVLIEDASSPVLIPAEMEQLKQGKIVESVLLGIAEGNISEADEGEAKKFSKISTEELLNNLDKARTKHIIGSNTSRRNPFRTKGGRKTRKNKRRDKTSNK